MDRNILPIALFMLGMGCTAPELEPVSQTTTANTPPANDLVQDNLPGQQSGAWKTLPHEPGTLVFGENDTLRTGLQDLQLMKELSAPSGLPWYLFRARVANKGGEKEMAMYILCPDKQVYSRSAQEPWHMPGRLFDGPNEESYYEAEVFAGEVLRDTIGVIWYDRSLMPDGEWKENTVLLNLTGPMPDTLVLFGHGRKSSTISLAFHGKCELLESVDQHVRP
ncbi:MAG: hypothetical protein ABIY71_07090 [Flavobacteriales bacterium]